MDEAEAEVERVAKVMHSGFQTWGRAQPFTERWSYAEFAWEELPARQQAAYRAVVRAVLADLCPAPLTVSA